jgi:hypothetical protein
MDHLKSILTRWSPWSSSETRSTRLTGNTIEVFDNVGGNLFPFQSDHEGAQIQKGVHRHSRLVAFSLRQLPFLGGGRNESPGIFSGRKRSLQVQDFNDGS